MCNLLQPDISQYFRSAKDSIAADDFLIRCEALEADRMQVSDLAQDAAEPHTKHPTLSLLQSLTLAASIAWMHQKHASISNVASSHAESAKKFNKLYRL